MRPVVTADEMRALDRATIDEIGLPGAVLMETAGRAVADAVVEALAGRTGPVAPVAVVCGPGNNGGDGYVVARVLRERGVAAVAYLATPRSAVRGDAALHLGALEHSGGEVHDVSDAEGIAEHAAAITGAAVVVDALLGVGLARPLEGLFAQLVDLMNASPGIRVAVDIPSGVDADTGRAWGGCVDAHITVTMGALKIGLVSAPGFARAGDVRVAEIGIPARLMEASDLGAGLVEEADMRALVPRPGPLDHKGRRGHTVIVGGSPGKRGAARLAAHAALRAGAGLVTLAGAPAPGGELVAPDPIMTEVVEGAAALTALLAGKAALAIGPGLVRGDAGAALVAAVLAAGVPAVIDADGLNQLAGHLERVAGAAGPVVLTPHPGEAARLLGVTAAEIEADRLAAARTLAARSRAVVVLKGARTIVCDGTLGDELCAINPTGGPALATGGTGDVLAGTVAALLGQGLAAADAARLGVWVHGAAGDRAARRWGGRGATASDVADEIAPVLADLARAP